MGVLVNKSLACLVLVCRVFRDAVCAVGGDVTGEASLRTDSELSTPMIVFKCAGPLGDYHSLHCLQHAFSCQPQKTEQHLLVCRWGEVSTRKQRRLLKAGQVDSYSPELKCGFPDLWPNTDPRDKEGVLRFFFLQHVETFSVLHFWEEGYYKTKKEEKRSSRNKSRLTHNICVTKCKRFNSSKAQSHRPLFEGCNVLKIWNN